MSKVDNQEKSSLDILLQKLPSRADLKGKEFEKASQWFLTHDPEFKSQLRSVWLWNDWPGAWGPDKGIDLIAETFDDEIWAIQCKGYDPDGSSVPTKDISQFVTESGRPQIHLRLLISTGPITDTSQTQLNHQEKPTKYLLYPQLKDRPIDWRAFFNDSIPIRPAPLDPKPHQIEAINDVVDGFSSRAKGKLIMACGTGKTLVGIRVAEKLQTDRTLVLVPSIALISQIANDWMSNSLDPFECRYVCSDQTVKNNDRWLIHSQELGSPVIDDPEEIRSFLEKPGRLVVFSTYQSSPKVAQAQTLGAPDFDLVIADEAHHCAGKVDTAFSVVLEADSIKAAHRIFMTATPRIVPKAVKDAASMNDIATTSMDDESQFGPEFHHLTFGKAIEDEILSEYQLVILGVNSEDVSNLITNRRLVEQIDPAFRGDAESLATYIAMLKAIETYKLTKVITFHNRVEKADTFQKTLARLNSDFPSNQSVPGLWTSHIRGTMRSDDRRRVLEQFKSYNGGTALLSNARCLGEGVDIRAIDGIAFIDPKRSPIDIVQAVGRAIRKNAAEKIGTIIIPVFINETSTESVEDQLEADRFRPIWQVLRALKDHDKVLGEEIDQLRFQKGRHGRVVGDLPPKIVIDMPESVGAEFRGAITTKIIESTTQPWEFWAGLLESYVEEFGDALVPNKHEQNGFKLGTWVEKQRSAYRRGDLSRERIDRLNAVQGWNWEGQDLDAVWEDNYENLLKFVKANGNANVPAVSGDPLATWCDKQRQAHKTGRLSAYRISKLSSLNGWFWDKFEAAWEIRFAALQKFHAREGHSNVPQEHYEGEYDLGKWVQRQRTAYKKRQEWKGPKSNRVRLISDDQIARLVELGFIWEPRAAKDAALFEKGLNAYKKYVTRHKTYIVEPGYKDEDGYPVDSWMQRNRRRYSGERGSLSTDQIAALEAVAGVKAAILLARLRAPNRTK